MPRIGRGRHRHRFRRLGVAAAAGAAVVLIPIRLLRSHDEGRRRDQPSGALPPPGPVPDTSTVTQIAISGGQHEQPTAAERAGTSGEQQRAGSAGRERSSPAFHLPAPSYWPAVLAAGLTLACFGLVTHWVFILLGVVVLALGIAGWIGDLLHG